MLREIIEASMPSAAIFVKRRSAFLASGARYVPKDSFHFIHATILFFFIYFFFVFCCFISYLLCHFFRIYSFLFLHVLFLYSLVFIILSTKLVRNLMSFIFLRNDYFILKRGSAIPYDEIQGRQEKGKESMRAPVLTTEALEGTNQYISFAPLFLFLFSYIVFFIFT